MKKIILWLIFILYVWTVYGFEHEWFSTYYEADTKISATCKQQCIAIGPLLIGNDYVKLEGGVKWKWTILVWFMVGNQILPFIQEKIEGQRTVSLSGEFASIPQINTIPSDSTIVMLVQGNIELSGLEFEIWRKWTFEKIASWIKSAKTYVWYSPRTINFLEWPMWNGRYIVRSFFYWLFFMVLICVVAFYLVDRKQRKNTLLTWWIVILFFWILVDLFVSLQQINLYQEITNSEPQKQTRYGRQEAEIQYLDYVKQIVPYWSNVYIHAPYPYDFELQYRLYPHARIGTTWNSSYVLWYNPYGEKNQFNYVNPIVSETSVQLWGVSYPLIINNVFWPQGGVLQIK